MDQKEQIISLIRQKGPSLPTGVYKELNTNTLFASAMLGELVSNGSLKVTHLKRGTSPYYYLEEQKDHLQQFSTYLNEKDQRAYSLLKEKKVLQDSELTPLIRVSLRVIKDYAVPLTISFNNQQQTFWKWYLMSNEEAEKEIKQILKIDKPDKKPVEEIKKEIPKKIEQKTIPKSPVIKKPIERGGDTTDGFSVPFLDQLTNHFKKNNINVVEKNLMNKKGTEIDFILELPSAVGNLQYYCKAKSKKKINDSDIASALVQSQQKRLPVLLLITGEMTKKSKEMLLNEFKGVTVQQL